MRSKEKQDYVNVVLEQLDCVNSTLNKSLRTLKTTALMELAATISKKLGCDTPDFPERTDTQRARIINFTNQGRTNEPDTVS
jgi:hypothetical protein